jgi:glycosyltransferase involved in cell wall biosynthesis
VSLSATVIIPTHDHGPTLHYAIRSVLSQSIQDFELFIVGDGATGESRGIIQDYVNHDSRLRFFYHPKGPRHGEIYRHQALHEARGTVVCYLSDDDLWLPGHLEYMRELLRDSDFAHVLPVTVRASGEVLLHSGTLSRPECREWIRSGRNFVPLSAGGHTLAFYRTLPHGWRTAPAGIPTDLYMWQQILSAPGCRSQGGLRPTMVNFPSPERKEWSIQQRLNELQDWERKLVDPNFEKTLMLSALEFLTNRTLNFEGALANVGAVEARLTDLETLLKHQTDRTSQLDEKIHAIENTITWRARNRLLRIPFLAVCMRRVAKSVFGR